VDKPFSRGVPFLKEDVDLMIDCFLANFRINPHNNDTLKVCTTQGSNIIVPLGGWYPQRKERHREEMMQEY
jgi:hypothetical protein